MTRRAGLLMISATAVVLNGCGSTPAPSTMVSAMTISGVAPGSGQSAAFTATATLAGGGQQNVTSQATWSSSNTSVATVSGSGVVTDIGLGQTNIQAAYGGVTGSQSLTLGATGSPFINCAPTIDDATDLGRTLLHPTYAGPTVTQVTVLLTSKDATGSYRARLVAQVDGVAVGQPLETSFSVSTVRVGVPVPFAFGAPMPAAGALRMIVTKQSGPGELSWEGNSDGSCPVLVTADAAGFIQVGPKIPVAIFR